MQKNHDTSTPGPIPRHVVIIMDGNGRWARRKNLDRLIGHREGIKSARSVVRAAREIGIEYVTLYAFSAQNWKRPGKEVLALMDLLRNYLSSEGEKLVAQNTRLNAIGNLSNLPPDIRKLLGRVMKMTEKCDSLTITLALSYGGREEIINAVNSIIAEGEEKNGDRGRFPGISLHFPPAGTGSAHKDRGRDEAFQLSSLAACLCRNIRH